MILLYLKKRISIRYINTDVLCSSGGPSLGKEEEQAEDELREVESRPALLLRQEHHPQDFWEALRLPFRLRPAEPAGIHGGGAAQHAGSSAGHRGLNPNPTRVCRCRPPEGLGFSAVPRLRSDHLCSEPGLYSRLAARRTHRAIFCRSSTPGMPFLRRSSALFTENWIFRFGITSCGLSNGESIINNHSELSLCFDLIRSASARLYS